MTVSAAVEGSRLVLRVTDTGVGIAADDLKRIGDPFFQAGKTYQRRHEGTGLGLSIVKGLVGLHRRRDDRAEQDRRRHHRDGRIAADVHAAGTAPSSNIATLTPALRSATTGPSPSGEEKCLDELPRTMRCRAAAAARRRLRSRQTTSAALRCACCCTVRRTWWRALLAVAAVCAIITNALFLQAGRHPSPMFGSVVTLPVPAPAVASPLPRPRPVELAAKPVEPEPVEAKPVEIKSADSRSADIKGIDSRTADIRAADPMTSLVVKSAVAPVAAPSNVARPPAPIPAVSREAAQAAGARRVAAVQRALTQYGYGQLKPTGTVGADTQAAIAKFEHDAQASGDRADVRSPGARTHRDDRAPDRLA